MMLQMLSLMLIKFHPTCVVLIMKWLVLGQISHLSTIVNGLISFVINYYLFNCVTVINDCDLNRFLPEIDLIFMKAKFSHVSSHLCEIFSKSQLQAGLTFVTTSTTLTVH